MYKIILMLSILCASVNAQKFNADKIKGTVKALTGTSENWFEVNEESSLDENTVIMTGKNSSVSLSRGDIHFVLRESSAVPLSALKKMSLDDLLLALAMEDMLDAPKNKNKNKSLSTAVYGTKSSGKDIGEPAADDFGFRRLNGAVQLAQSGFKESALITARETYRKYPSTKEKAYYRIYFAGVLLKCGLYEEAFDEYNRIKSLSLTENEMSEVEQELDFLSTKLTNY